MGWEVDYINSVMGECSTIFDSDLVNYTESLINQLPWIGDDNNQLAWNHPSKILKWEDIPDGTTYTLFGLPLLNKETGEDSGKVLCYRSYFYNKGNTTNYYLYNNGRWAIYDKETLAYTDLTVVSPSSGGGFANAVEHNVNFMFSIKVETYDNKEQTVLFGGVSGSVKHSNGDIIYYLGLQGLPLTTYLPNYDVDMEGVEFSPEYGEESTPAGYSGGSFDDSSDTIGIPTKPQYGLTSPGFLNVYKVTSAGLQALGEALFPSLPSPTAQGLDAITEVLEYIGNMMWNSKLLDYIIDCHIIPVTPTTGSAVTVRAGGKGFINPSSGQTYSAPPVTEDFVDFDCGSLSIPEYWANFLDFYNTKCKLFLPFIGYVDIKPEYWNGGSVNVYYRFNVIDGSFMCWVKSTSGKSKLTSTIVGQYAGNACIHVPVNARDYSTVISGLVGTAGALAVGAVGGVPAAMASGAIAKGVNAASGMANAGVNAINSKPTFSQSNSYAGSNSIMSCRKPYLLIERSTSQFSRNYPKEIGLPLNVTKSLSRLTGLTICSNVRINFACTEDEAREITAALQEGVIL